MKAAEKHDSDRPGDSPRLRLLTLALGYVAAITAQIALGTHLGPGATVAGMLGLAVAMLVVARWLPTRGDCPDLRAQTRSGDTKMGLSPSAKSTQSLTPKMRQAVQGAILLALVLPLLVPDDSALGLGNTLALRLLAGLRGIAVVAATASCWPRMLRLAAMASTFVVFFAFALGSGSGVFLATAVFFLIGLLWLTEWNWLDVEPFIAMAQPRCVPSAAIGLVAGTTAAILIVAVLVYPSNVDSLRETLGRWSGSIGEQRLNSMEKTHRTYRQQAALTNLTQEKYGQADAAGGSIDSRRQMLPGDDDSARARGTVERLPLIRSSQPTPLDAKQLQAMFQAAGSLPQRLPVTTFDRFDGLEWQSEPPRDGQQFSAEIANGQGWLSIFDSLEMSLDPSTLATQGTLARDDAPLPEGADWIDMARSAAFRQMADWQGTGRVIDPEVMKLSPERLARLLSQGPGPIGNPDHLVTQYDIAMLMAQLRQDPKLLAEFTKLLQGSEANREAVLRRFLEWRQSQQPRLLPPKVRELVDSWTAGKRRGWDEVQAVVDGLRNHAQHDPKAIVPPKVDDPTSYFLLQSRRGPDYLFATSGCVLLRSLGYPSRLVGGFYPRAENRSFWSGHTPVSADDVHYWIQSQLPDGTWVNLEPTPGYEMARPPITWSARLEQLAAWGHTFLPLALAAGLGFLFRRQLAGLAATWHWRWQMRRGPAAAVIATWRLLERRAALAGAPRPRGTTLRAWHHDLQRVSQGGLSHFSAEAAKRRDDNGTIPFQQPTDALTPLADLADRALYAPGGLGQADTPVADLCRRAERQWTAKRFRADRRGHQAGCVLARATVESTTQVRASTHPT